MNDVQFKPKAMRHIAFRTSLLTAAVIALAGPMARAEGGQGLSEASALSVDGSAQIVSGSVKGIQGSAELVVESVVFLADGVRCVLRGAAEVGRVVILIPLKVAGAASLVVGQTVEITTQATGWLITKAGQAIAFLPNEAGRALLFSEPVSR